MARRTQWGVAAAVTAVVYVTALATPSVSLAEVPVEFVDLSPEGFEHRSIDCSDDLSRQNSPPLPRKLLLRTSPAIATLPLLGKALISNRFLTIESEYEPLNVPGFVDGERQARVPAPLFEESNITVSCADVSFSFTESKVTVVSKVTPEKKRVFPLICACLLLLAGPFSLTSKLLTFICKLAPVALMVGASGLLLSPTLIEGEQLTRNVNVRIVDAQLLTSSVMLVITAITSCALRSAIVNLACNPGTEHLRPLVSAIMRPIIFICLVAGASWMISPDPKMSTMLAGIGTAFAVHSTLTAKPRQQGKQLEYGQDTLDPMHEQRAEAMSADANKYRCNAQEAKQLVDETTRQELEKLFKTPGFQKHMTGCHQNLRYQV